MRFKFMFFAIAVALLFTALKADESAQPDTPSEKQETQTPTETVETSKQEEVAAEVEASKDEKEAVKEAAAPEDGKDKPEGSAIDELEKLSADGEKNDVDQAYKDAAEKELAYMNALKEQAKSRGVDEDLFLNDERPEYKDLVPGNCPKPGRFPPRVKNFDFHQLAGTWIRVVDEKDFSSNYTCLSMQFTPLNKTFAQMFHSEMYTESHKEFRLQRDPEFDEGIEYLIDINRYIDFSFENDSSIGYIRTERSYEYTKEHEDGAWDPYTFDKQFLRYGQVIDTDYENYFVFWSCWEFAEYYNRDAATYVDGKEIWKMTRGGEWLDPDDKNNHVPIKFQPPGKEAIHRLALRKTKATIFWRPDYDEDKDEYKFNKKSLDWDLIFKKRDLIDDLFPGLSFKKKNVKQFHHQSCNYDPYQKMMTYHADKAEKARALKEKMDKKMKDKKKSKKKDKKAALKKEREKAQKKKTEEKTDL